METALRGDKDRLNMADYSQVNPWSTETHMRYCTWSHVCKGALNLRMAIFVMDPAYSSPHADVTSYETDAYFHVCSSAESLCRVTASLRWPTTITTRVPLL